MKSNAFVFALFLPLSGTSLAENSCIRTDRGNVILTDRADCTVGLASFHREAGWKFALVEDADVIYGCWRTDGTLIHVELEGQTVTRLASDILSINACPPPEAQVRDDLWESAIEDCENLSVPKDAGRAACDAAMKLAESSDESDPRFVRTLEGLSSRLERLVEKEMLLHRVSDIYQKHFSADYMRQVGAIAALGHLYREREDWKASIPFYREAIELGRRHLGPEHLEVVVVTMIFGKLYLDHGMLAEAKTSLLQALAGAESNQTSHWYMANHVASSCARFLADAYRAEGNVAEADRYTEMQRRHKQSPTSNERESEDVFLGYAEES